MFVKDNGRDAVIEVWLGIKLMISEGTEFQAWYLLLKKVVSDKCRVDDVCVDKAMLKGWDDSC